MKMQYRTFRRILFTSQLPPHHKSKETSKMTSQRKSTRNKTPSQKVAVEGNTTPNAVGNRPKGFATPKKPAASSSVHRSKKTNSGGTTASSVTKGKAAKKGEIQNYFDPESVEKVVRSYAMTNASLSSKNFVSLSREPGYALMNPSDPVARDRSSTAFARQRKTTGGIKKALQTMRTAALRPPLHHGLLHAHLFYASDNNTIGVPSLGGGGAMSFYTMDGVLVTDPARLQQLQAERGAEGSTTAAAVAAPAVAPSTPGNDDVREAMMVCLVSSTNANKAVEAVSNAATTISGAVTELTTEFRDHRAQSNARHEQSEARLGKIEDELKLVRSGKKSSESGYGHGNLVPPSTDKKPAARPSPKRLFVTAGGTGFGADDVGGSFGAHDSVVANAGVLKATPVTDRASISFADTSAAPSEDLEKWQFEGLAEGNTVQPTLVKRLLQQYVRDESINDTLRRGNATRQDENFVNSISIALTAIKPFPFVKCCVYRGIELTHEDAFRFKALMRSGEPFVEPGLLSASAKSLDELQNRTYVQRNTYFAIRSKSGRLIQKYSKREDEWEVLFAAGTSFRILSFEDTTPVVDPGVSGWGRYKIVMEEVESKIWGL